MARVVINKKRISYKKEPGSNTSNNSTENKAPTIELQTDNVDLSSHIFNSDNFDEIPDDTVFELFDEIYKKHLNNVLKIVVTNLAFNTIINNVETNINRIIPEGIDLDDTFEQFENIFSEAISLYAMEVGLDLAVSKGIKHKIIDKLNVNNFKGKSVSPVAALFSRASLEKEVNKFSEKMGIDPTLKEGPYGDNNSSPVNNSRVGVLRKTSNERQ